MGKDNVKHALRKILHEKQSGICDMCGCNLTIDTALYNTTNYLQIDHVTPGDASGGVRGLCRSCNSRRNNYVGIKNIDNIFSKLSRMKDSLDISFDRVQDDIKLNIITEDDVTRVKGYVINTMQQIIDEWGGVDGTSKHVCNPA